MKENEASVRLGHKSLRTLMKRSSCWYLPGDFFVVLLFFIDDGLCCLDDLLSLSYYHSAAAVIR